MSIGTKEQLPANKKYKAILELDRLLTSESIPHQLERAFDGWKVSYPSAEESIGDAIEHGHICDNGGSGGGDGGMKSKPILSRWPDRTRRIPWGLVALDAVLLATVAGIWIWFRAMVNVAEEVIG